MRSAIGIAAAEDIEGPYNYVDTIIYSGFHSEEAYDGNSDVNKHWENTNVSDLIEEGVFEEPNSEWFTENGSYNNKLYPNAIDANILYDENGDLWMTYGSWSGGTFILQLEKETGLPIYPREDGVTEDGRMIDKYFGTKIAAGYGRSAEGTYAVHDKETGYYYLYLTYGGLASDGGYQMRQFRAEDIEGPYVDASGNQAVYPESFDRGVGNFPGTNDHKEIGNKLIGNFLFKRDFGETGSGIGTGYLSPGHNSYHVDDELDKEFLVFHTRFPQQGEMHEVRVHQTFKNNDQWPVPTPYRYAGETIEPVSEAELVGDYKHINHGNEITGNLTESTWIQFNEDHSISGSVTGTWELYDDYRTTITIDGDGVYDGVFIRQWNPTAEKWVMTYSGMSEKGTVVWGSHVESSSDEELVQMIKKELENSLPDTVINDFVLPTEATRGTRITWESSHSNIISPEGEVVRPAYGSKDVTVTLTANLTLGDISEVAAIAVNVLPEEEGGLVAWYDFNDGFSDHTGNYADAVTTGDRINKEGGTVTLVEGIADQAAYFDGNSGLRLDDGLISSNSYSISFWVNPEEITDFTTTFFGARTENNWISIVPRGPVGNTMVWSHNGEEWYDAPTEIIIPTNEWSHLTLTVDEGNVTVYLNGEPLFSGVGFPDIFTSVDNVFALGVNYWDTPFKGLMDEIRIYERVILSEEEVFGLYQNPGGIVAEEPDNLGEEDGDVEEDRESDTEKEAEDSGNELDDLEEQISESENQSGDSVKNDETTDISDSKPADSQEETNKETLPQTGVQQSSLWIIGVVLIAGGALLFYFTKKRKSE